MYLSNKSQLKSRVRRVQTACLWPQRGWEQNGSRQRTRTSTTRNSNPTFFATILLVLAPPPTKNSSPPDHSFVVHGSSEFSSNSTGLESYSKYIIISKIFVPDETFFYSPCSRKALGIPRKWNFQSDFFRFSPKAFSCPCELDLFICHSVQGG